MSEPVYVENHRLDENKNPAGGFNRGIGFNITWQDGPLGRGKDRQKQNGAFVEEVLLAVISRMEFYQRTKFACTENADVLKHLYIALEFMQARTADREEREVEGTYEK